ncbi:ABC transporter substrate-binding protein [Paenibacillus sp. 1P07SE]|uniref:ABC transporter substrate-binding protein n=1 Tax=Paenibacillus sp. 1P07SE TaxID=3132209 RepID=UPI0039A760B4
MKGRLHLLLKGLLCVLLLLPATTVVAKEANEPGSEAIPLAALLPLSGELASKGHVRKYAIEQGVADANKRWEEERAGLRFELTVVDSQSDPAVALQKAEQLAEEGVRVFIAGSSAEVEALQPWAAGQDVVIVSYSSTSPSLGIADDGIFRMVADDTHQAQALAELLAHEGVYGIVPVYRNDTYGRELTDLITQEFEGLFGMTAAPVVYEPDTTDWDGVIAAIEEQVAALPLGAEQVAVVLISFDEAAELLNRSEGLPEVRWFGSDAVTLSPILTSDAQAAAHAARVQLTGVTFGVPDSPLTRAVKSRLTEAAEGELLPDALFAYDIPGMLASVLSELDDPLDAQELRERLVEGSARYAGATGWTSLDERGDRKYYHYDIWTLQEQVGDYQWLHTAQYVRTPGSPGYIAPVETAGGSILDRGQAGALLFGYPDSPFQADRALSRAEFTYLLMHTLGMAVTQPGDQRIGFSDAGDLDPRATAAVASALQAGIIAGYGDGTFKPNQSITWLEAITMTVKAKTWTPSGQSESLSDEHAIPVWAMPYVESALEKQLIAKEPQLADVLVSPVTQSEAVLMMIILRRSEES